MYSGRQGRNSLKNKPNEDKKWKKLIGSARMGNWWSERFWWGIKSGSKIRLDWGLSEGKYTDSKYELVFNKFKREEWLVNNMEQMEFFVVLFLNVTKNV